jgi:flagellar assembly protein FliH
MTSSSDARTGEPVLRGAQAESVTAASFGVNLRRDVPVDAAAVGRVKEAARTAGYAEGWAQGRREATVAAQAARDQAHAAEQGRTAEALAGLQGAFGALDRVVDGLEQQTAGAVEEFQDLIVRYALEIAEGVLGRELTQPDGRGFDALRRAMTAAPASGPATVRLHPDDYRTLTDSAPGGDYNYEGRLIRLRPDPGLQPGDAVAEVGSASVDATIAAAMNRVREVLQQ